MKARNLIESATYDPAQLKALGDAFDAAWVQIAPHVGQRPEAVEAARMKLANLMLTLAKDGTQNVKNLSDIAVKLMFAEPTKL